MAAKCVEDLKAAVEAVKADYANDPKWSNIIAEGEKLVGSAEQVDSPSETSPGQKSADQVHNQVNESIAPETVQTAKPENPADDKTEPAVHENGENSKVESVEHPKDMKGAAKLAILMLRNKK